MITYELEDGTYEFLENDIELVDELIMNAENKERLYLVSGREFWLGYESTFSYHFHKLLKENNIQYKINGILFNGKR